MAAERDQSYIIERLIAKAHSTTFEGEREALLRKVEELKIKYHISGVGDKEVEDLHKVKVNHPNVGIHLMRIIFTNVYYPGFLDEFPFSRDHIPYNFFLLNFDGLQRKYEMYNSRLYSEDVKKANKEMFQKMREWISKEKAIFNAQEWRKGKPWYNFSWLDDETVKWLQESPGSPVMTLEQSTNVAINFFNEKKRAYMSDLNNGYFDRYIKQTIDPYLLTA